LYILFSYNFLGREGAEYQSDASQQGYQNHLGDLLDVSRNGSLYLGRGPGGRMEEVDQAPFFMGYHGKIIENHLSMRVSLTANIIQWLVVFKHSFFTPGMRIPLLWKEGWPHQHHPTEVVRFSISGIFVLPAGFAQANPRDWRGWTDAGRFYGGNGSICCREKPGALFGSLLRKDAEDEENEEWGLDVWLAVKKTYVSRLMKILIIVIHCSSWDDVWSPVTTYIFSEVSVNFSGSPALDAPW